MRRIGGSDIAKLLGLSRYGNEADVYRRVVESEEDEWNVPMQRGAAVEPVLRAHAQRAMGLELEDTESDYHVCPRLDFAHAQVDDLARWQGLPVAVNYKSCNRWAAKKWGRPESDEVPEDIRAQATWEMLCTGREMSLLVVGFGEDVEGPELFHVVNVAPYVVQRDEEFERYCILVAQQFWERHVLPRVPPSVKPLGKKQAKAS